MKLRGMLAAGASAALVCAGLLVAGASSASAADTDQIWYQSIGSPSQDAPCPESDPADLAKGWTKWVKGYEMWPNDGKGGWTCGRSILWAKGSPPPSSTAYPAGVGCVLYGGDYIDFNGSWFVSGGSPAWSDNACAQSSGFYSNPAVVPDPSWDNLALCRVNFPATVNAELFNDAVECRPY